MNKPERPIRIIVDSDLTEIDRYAERAACLLQDLTEDYFNKGDSRDPDARLTILYSYDDNRIRAEIAFECLYRLRQAYERVVKALELAAAP